MKPSCLVRPLTRSVPAALVLVLALVHGCSIRVPQAEGLVTLWRARSSADELEPYRWELQWAGRVASVFAVDLDGALTAFTSPDGLQILLDGWQIRAAEGLFSGGALLIEVATSGERSFTVGGQVVARVQCGQWLSSNGLNADTIEHSQHCDDPIGTNTIHVGATGDIQRIQFRIHPDYPPLILEHSSLAAVTE